MNLEKREMKIGNIVKEISYLPIEILPSNNRSYKDIGKIYVRGLFYGEVVDLSKIEDDSLETSLRVYRDAIQIENPQYKLEDLELIDYIFVTTIANILTTENYKWFTDFRCDNIIKNPKIREKQLDIEEYEDKINLLTSKLNEEGIPEEDIEDIKKDIETLKNLIKKTEEEITKLEPEVVCNTKVSAPITLDDLSFEIADENLIFPVYYNFGGVEIEIHQGMVDARGPGHGEIPGF